MPSADVLDIILRLQNLSTVRAGLTSVAAGVREVGAAGRSTSRNIAGMQRNSKALTATLRILKIAAVGVVGALALAAVDGTKMSIKYDAAIERLHTQAGVAQRLLPGLNRTILDMAQSGRFAQGPQELADGLYHLVSIGMPASKALHALRIAAQGAAIGQADLEATVTAMGSAWRSGIKGAGDFNHVMALANATVGAGNMRLEDIVQSLGTGVLPAAKVAGLGIKDVFSALATLKDEGWQGSSAMAQLSTALHFLYNPTDKAKKAMAALGLRSDDLARALRKPQGLHTALQLLHDRLNAFSRDPVAQEQMLGNILPGGRGRVMLVLLNQLDVLDQKYRQISRTTSQFGDDIKKTHETAAFRIHAAWSRIQADLIILGHLLQPIAVAAAVGFSHMLTWLLYIPSHLADVVHWWSRLPAPIQDAGMFLGTFIGIMATFFLISKGIAAVTILWSMLTSAVETLQLAMLLLMDNPLLLFLAAVGAALITLYIKWKPFRDIVDGIVQYGGKFLKWMDDTLGKLGPLGTAVKIFFGAWLAWKAVGFLSMIKGLLGARTAMTAAATAAGTEAGAVTAAASAEEASAMGAGAFAAKGARFAAIGRVLGRMVGFAAGAAIAYLMVEAAQKVAGTILGGGFDALGSPADTQVAELSDPTLQRAERHLKKINTPSRIANRKSFMDHHPGLTRLNTRYNELQGRNHYHYDPSIGNVVQSRREKKQAQRDHAEMERLRKRLHAGHFPGFAFGGTNSAGGMSLVGERGPELVELPGGARVSPIQTSTSARLQPIPLTAGVTGTSGDQGGGEGGTYVLQVHLDRKVLAEAVFDHAQQKAARK